MAARQRRMAGGDGRAGRRRLREIPTESYLQGWSAVSIYIKMSESSQPGLPALRWSAATCDFLTCDAGMRGMQRGRHKVQQQGREAWHALVQQSTSAGDIGSL